MAMIWSRARGDRLSKLGKTDAMWQESLKLNFAEQENIKDVSCPKEKPQRLSALFVPCLMNGALCRTISPSVSDMLCGKLVPRLLPSLTPRVERR